MDSNSPKKKEENIHAGHRERMYSKFMKNGISAFEDHEILEFLLFYVEKRKDTNKTGHALIKEFGSLEKVFSATVDELTRVLSVGEKGAMLLSMIGQLNHRINCKPIKKGTYLNTSQLLGKYCIDYFKNLSTERLVLISMTCDHMVIDVDVISNGDHSATSVDIRKILNTALKRKAAMVVLAHNHPGDSPNPSDSDIIISRKIINVLEGIDILVADHIICNDTTFVSLDERGFLSR